MSSERRNERTLSIRFSKWVRIALRVSVAVTTLYLCLFILQFLLLIPNLPKVHGAKSDRAFQLTISKAQPNVRDWYVNGEITGRAPPKSTIDVSIAQRTFVGSSDSEGKVSVRVQLPLGRAEIRISTRRPGENDPREDFIFYGGVSLSYQDGSRIELLGAPVIDLALAVKDSNLLWVSGRAPPYSWITLESEAGQEVEGFDVGGEGIFEKVLSLKSAPPARLRTRPEQYRAAPNASEPVTVMVVSELPLERSIQIHFDDGVPVVQLKAKLPEHDAQLQAFARGYVTQRNFINAIWGWRPIFGNDEAEQDISLQNGVGVVRFTGTWFGPVNEMQIGEPDAAGLGEQLLLSANDSVYVDFHGVRPKWFDSPLPTEWNENTVCWKGPLILPRDRPRLRFGISLPQDVSAEAPEEALRKKQSISKEESQGEAKTMRDFVATDRSSPNESWLRPAWRSLISLLPCLGFLWLAFRKKFGRLEVWPPAGAAVAILGASSLAYLLYNFLGRVTRPWFDHLLGIGLSTVQFTRGESPLSVALSSAETNAFLLLALGIAGLAPFYLHHLRGYWDAKPSSPAVPPGYLRRLASTTWITTKIIWGALWATILFAPVAWIWKYRGNDDTGPRLVQFLQSHVPSLKVSVRELADYVHQSDLWLVWVAVLAVPLLLTLGVRAAMFGLGFLLAVLRFLEPERGVLSAIEQGTGLFSLAQKIPWWVVIAVVAVLSYFFIIRLLRWLVPREQLRSQRRRLWIVGAALITLSVGLPFVPAKWLLVIAGTAFFTIVIFVLSEGTREFESVRSWAERWGIGSGRLLFIGVVIGLVLTWPLPEEGTPLGFRNLFRLFSIHNSIVSFLIAGVFLLLLRDYSKEQLHRGSVLEPPVLSAGELLFALFVVQSPNTWAFIPVPFIVAWLVARFWLIRPAERVSHDLGDLATESSDKWRTRVTGALASVKAQSRMRAIEKSLDKKLESTDITPQEHKEKQKNYYDYVFEGTASPAEGRDPSLAETLFLLPGPEPPWQTAVRFVQVGALLGAVPLFITLYSYLPGREYAHPYPISDLLSVLLRAIGGWLLIAFFFGFFYIHIRGSSGLRKGLALSAAVILPAGVYQLLNAPDLDQLQPFLFWMTQVFAFCTLLGGVADYRTLQAYGYRLRDLLTLNNLPWISIYATSIVAAITPILITLISGKVAGVAKFFIETVLAPHAKGAP